VCEFNILIVGVSIRIEAIFPSTKSFCKDYLTTKEPEFTITITQSDIDFERDITMNHFSDAYLETLALHRKLAVKLLDYDVLLIHGSVVAVDGQAYLFAAKSGTGKTTHTRLWIKNFPDAYVVNGDKPLVKITNDNAIAYGTPWRGKENYGTNTNIPLKAICMLERDTYNHIEQITKNEALPMLFQQIYCHNDREAMSKTLGLINRLRNNTELYRLGCNMLDEAAYVAYEGMR
jgi:hypothetical protein